MSETTRPHQPRVCGECRHWGKWIETFQNAPVEKGYCQHPFPLMFIQYADDEDTLISTYATFGCNQWESNNASEESERVS